MSPISLQDIFQIGSFNIFVAHKSVAGFAVVGPSFEFFSLFIPFEFFSWQHDDPHISA